MPTPWAVTARRLARLTSVTAPAGSSSLCAHRPTTIVLASRRTSARPAGSHRRVLDPLATAPARRHAGDRDGAADQERGGAAARAARGVRDRHERQPGRRRERRPEPALVRDQRRHPGASRTHAHAAPDGRRRGKATPQSGAERDQIRERHGDQHFEPGGKVIGVDEGPRDAPALGSSAREPFPAICCSRASAEKSAAAVSAVPEYAREHLFVGIVRRLAGATGRRPRPRRCRTPRRDGRARSRRRTDRARACATCSTPRLGPTGKRLGIETRRRRRDPPEQKRR